MSTATVTGKVMGGLTMTAKVFTNIRSFSIDCDRQTATIVDSAGINQVIDISAQTTFTLTFSAPNYSLTIA